MKISELLTKLQDIQDQHGDLLVLPAAGPDNPGMVVPREPELICYKTGCGGLLVAIQ